MTAMPTFVTELELVDKGEGTLKYLVAETGREPFVAQNIHELLEDVDDFDSADVFLLTDDMQTIPVYVAMGEHDDDWWVSLGSEPGGDNIEHVIYVESSVAKERHEYEVHEQFANGWKIPA